MRSRRCGKRRRALEALAATLPTEEAEIIEAGALMASDPALTGAVQQAILARGCSAGEAILEATGDLADAIAAIDDATLAARADDCAASAAARRG